MEPVSIGKLITEDTPQRDAIHIAIAPVTAGEKMYPGQPIRLEGEETAWIENVGNHIGIADPFLPGVIYPGQKFYMFLMPNTITSLKHLWTHPAFDNRPIPEWESPPVTTSQTGVMSTVVELSEKWLREFTSKNDCPDYWTVMNVINGDESDGYIDRGEYLHFNGLDAHGDIPDEFWDHVEIVTGKKFQKSMRPTYFSCSC